MGSEQAIEVLRTICQVIQGKREYLCELDAALGDGDHGISMAKSFHAVEKKLDEFEGQSLEQVLKAVGMTLISEVGGAMGPLFGTAFLEAGKAVAGKEHVDSADIAAMLAAAEAGIVKRGRAHLGDKTMLDAIHPAIAAAAAATEAGEGIAQTLQASAAASEAGVEATKAMLAKVGRASRLGERTLGHQDPGATSVSVIMRAAADALASDKG